MRPFPSPLEHLTAFVIVFAAGVISTASSIGYMERVRRNAVRDTSGPMRNVACRQ